MVDASGGWGGGAHKRGGISSGTGIGVVWALHACSPETPVCVSSEGRGFQYAFFRGYVLQSGI